MKIYRSTLPLVLCASVAACGDMPSKHLGPESQSAPVATEPALTIQSGEGEKLNLPWFVRDVQDMVNESSAPAAPRRPPATQ
jgi:hypothetical protein